VKYLVDTNVLSELSKRMPDPKVVTWYDQVSEHSLYVSAFTLGEIEAGIARLNDSSKQRALRVWFASVHDALRGNVVPFDADCALLWGRVQGRLAKAGTPVPLMDSLIGVTALRHALVLVTRNAAHFSPLGVDVFDPWA
jgi:predicted nucleic acid-binding protein